MLVLLDDSLEAAMSSPLRVALLHFLEDVAGAARLGRHFIVGKRSLLGRFAGAEALSEVARAVFADMEQSAPTRQGLADLVSWRVRVVANGSLGISPLGQGRVEIEVPLANAIGFSPWPSTVLLLENQTEGRWYLWLASRHARKKLGGARVELSVRGGGGSTLSREVQEIVRKQNELCLCIVESDMEHPDGARGSTALTALRAASAPHCFVHVLGVREVENTLPIELLEEVAPHLNRTEEILIYRRLWDGDKAGKAAPYLDLKQGERWCDLRDEASPRCEVLQLAASIVAAQEHDCEETSCTRKNCRCTLLPGLSNGLMAAIERRLDERPAFKEVDTCEWLQREWEEIGKALVAWGLGDERRAAL